MTNYQQGCRHKITDWSGLGHSLAQPGGKTQVQLAALWGEGVTQQNIRAARQKLGISRKKKTYGYQERDALKREAFREQLKTKAAGAIVYVDEAGIDHMATTIRMATVRLGNAATLTSWQANFSY
jgi:hypothetical protein